jgi:hypothetical protein
MAGNNGLRTPPAIILVTTFERDESIEDGSADILSFSEKLLTLAQHSLSRLHYQVAFKDSVLRKSVARAEIDV